MEPEHEAIPHGLQWSAQLPVDPDVDATAYDRAHHARVVALVFLGGCLGGLLRYAVTKHWPEAAGSFPWSTFAVNVVGAFVLAVVVEVATEVHPQSRYLRPLAGAGFCGALTTFSSIVVSVDRLAAHGHGAMAASYLLATLAAGLAAGALGLFVTRAVVR